MAFNLGTAIGYLMLDTSGFETGFKRAQSQLQTFTDKSKSWDSRFKSLSAGLTTLGSNLTKNVTLPLVGLGTAAAKSAIDFESAFTGVRKTVDATEEEFSDLEKGIIEMSDRMPQSAADIASVMEIAGQLGIRGTDSLLSFTETMVRLGDSTNLSSEEAATAIARIMNVMGTATEDVGRFGSTIVDLGNNFATTESEITEMANRLAAGGKLAGLTEPQILALATAMSSVGIQAEAGGTAMTQTFNAIEKAVANGGDKLEQFATVAGMSADQFIQAWETDPITAIQSFIQGLGDLEETGGSAVLALDALGLSGIRQSDMLKSLSQSGDLLTNTLETANAAWNENNALTQESETRYGTLASKLSILWNNVKNLAISFGTLLMPAIEKVTSVIQSITEKINSMSEGQKKALVTILAIAAAIGPVLLILGKIVSVITTIIKVVKLAVAVFGVVTTVVGGVVLIIGALVAAFILLWNNCESFREFWINLWDTIVEAFNTAVEWIRQAIQDVISFFSNLGQTVSDVWDMILETVSSVIQNIVNAVVAWGSSLYNGAVQSFNQMLQGITTVWSSITSWLSTALQTIVTTVTNIGSSLYNAGASIFNSFWQGLISVWNSIAAWVENAVAWIAGKLSGATANVSGTVNSYGGSYATGLDYVGSDRFVKVHEGEAILSKEENTAYRSGKSTGGDIYNFYSPKALTPLETARALKKSKKQLALGRT